MRRNKTGKENRINYIYYGADGSRTTLIPGEEGVTETIIYTLHSLDDDEYNIDRKETRRHTGFQEILDKDITLLDRDMNIEEFVIKSIQSSNLKKIVRAALEELKPKDRELIEWLYLNENTLSQKQAAELLGITEGSVKKKAMRVRGKLKKILQKKEEKYF